MAESNWNALEIKIPGRDLLQQVRGGLEALVVLLEIVKVLLEIISVFLLDFPNPVRAIVQALLLLIQALFESLKRTGLFAYYDFPDPRKDPNFERFAGGYPAFTRRFKASLYDGKDSNRPQPLPGGNQSGFVIIVVDADSISRLLAFVQILQRFFGREARSAQYTAPANARVYPAGKDEQGKTNPLLKVGAMFGADLQGLMLQWSLGSSQVPPDPSFSDLVASTSSEFVPTSWLIEKTSREGGPEILTVDGTTNFESRRGRTIKRKVKVRDPLGDYFRKFEEYIVINAGTETANYLLGQLGTFRYLDKNVQPEKVYHYRIRAFSGDIDVSSGKPNLPAPVYDSQKNEWMQRWPSANPSDPVVMGRPSPILVGRIPKVPPDFDVLKIIDLTFRMAFALGFHLPVPQGMRKGSDGYPVIASDIGKGSITNLSGPLGGLTPGLIEGQIAQSLESPVSVDPVTGDYSDVTHNLISVKLYSARMSNDVAAALLSNSGLLYPLRDLYQGVPPRVIQGAGYLRGGASSIQDMVLKFNEMPSGFPKTRDPKVYETYAQANVDPNTRKNLLDAVSYLTSLTTGGTSPDWVSVSLLRDIIPWSGAFIYDLLAKIEALLDAFRSSMEELKAFIDLIIRKIDALERFIRFLIEILNYLDSLSVGFYILSLSSTDRGIPGWVQAIDQAEGTPPPSGPFGYTAGLALAYSGSDVAAYVAAFSLIF